MQYVKVFVKKQTRTLGITYIDNQVVPHPTSSQLIAIC